MALFLVFVLVFVCISVLMLNFMKVRRGYFWEQFLDDNMISLDQVSGVTVKLAFRVYSCFGCSIPMEF